MTNIIAGLFGVSVFLSFVVGFSYDYFEPKKAYDQPVKKRGD